MGDTMIQLGAWLYLATGVVASLGVLAVTCMWSLDRIARAFRLNKAFIEWAIERHRMKRTKR